MITKIKDILKQRKETKINEEKALSRIEHLCELYNKEKQKQKQGLRNKADELQRILLKALKAESALGSSK